MHFSLSQYNKIGSAVYNIKWYNLSGNKALALVLIITMSHYPPKLKAGKFVDLSVYTFGVVSFSTKKKHQFYTALFYPYVATL